MTEQGTPSFPFRDLPEGTVTFLFTDIEGSTQLLYRLRDQFTPVVAEHHRILREAMTHWGGHVVRTEGDSFFVAFPRARNAVAAAVEVQRALAQYPWPEGTPIRVRMGLHTGEPEVALDDYVGLDVHRAARIAHVGYGGQVLLSDTTAALVGDELPEGVSLLDLGRHLLKDIRRPERISQLQIEGLPADFPALRSQEKLGLEEVPPAPGHPPYKGLQFFDEGDAEWFYGRQAVAARLAEAVHAQRFLAVVGASGSGKSSVVRAGVVPSLRRDTAVSWLIHIITPAAHPLEAVAVSLTRGVESVTATATLIDDLGADRRSLHLYAQKLLTQQAPGAGNQTRLLLIVDQFEELFTLCRSEAERQAFIDNLLTAVAEGSAVTALITLRADFYERVAQYAELRELVSSHQVYIGAMSAAELREAIEGPARRGGWECSAGLVDLILHDIGVGEGRQPEPGALPLLSHALLETWKRRRGNLLNLRAYTEAGGVRGAIAHTADTVYGSELTATQQQIARSIFLRLTELGEGTQDTRRRISIHELIPPGPAGEAEQIQDVLVKLADARLITTSEDMVEVAHEALIREWPQLREWLAQNREGLRLHRHLTEATEEWELLKRDPGALYRGARLAQVLEWVAANPNQLNAQEQAFLDASQEAAEREQMERESARLARERTRRAIIVGLTAGLVLALALTAAAVLQWRRADEQRRIAVSSQLAAQANARFDDEQYDLALLLSLEAYRSAATIETRGNLLSILERTPYLAILAGQGGPILATVFHPDGRLLAVCDHTGAVSLRQWAADAAENASELPSPGAACQALAFGPDGTTLAVAYDNGNISLWNSGSLTISGSLSGGHRGAVTGLAFSPDGQTLASGGADQRIVLWTLGEAASGPVLTGHSGKVTSLAFSPDGRTLASGSIDTDWNQTDNAVILWDVANGRALGELRSAQTANVTGLAFQRAGRILAAGYDNGTVLLWDVLQRRVDGDPLVVFREREPSRLVPLGVQVAFNPVGTLLATGDEDGGVILWDFETRRLHGGPYHVHSASVNGLAFSPDGGTLASSGADNRIVLWSIGAQIERLLPGSRAQAWSVAFSPDGQTLASGWSDGSILLWDAGSDWRPGRSMTGHTAGVTTLAFDPTAGGRMLASGSNDGKVIVWDLERGVPTTTPIADATGGLNSVAFSPDGSRLAFAGLDGAIYLCDGPNWTPASVGPLCGQSDSVWGLAFSPDGRRLASGEWDGLIRLWDAQTGQPAGEPLVGHTGPVLSLAFSPAGSSGSGGLRLASAGQDRRILLWNLARRQSDATIEGHADAVWSVAFSPDGAMLASGGCAQPGLYRDCKQGEIRLWDAATGRPLGPPLPSHAADARGLAFSPDGAWLAVATNEGEIGLWEVGLAAWQARACRIAGRDLRPAEWEEYLGGEPYRATCSSSS